MEWRTRGTVSFTECRTTMNATLYADGGSRGNPGEAAYGFVLNLANGRTIEEGVALGIATNNYAEYRGLIAGIERAVELGVAHLDIRLDSQLIVRQITGEYRVKEPSLKPLHEKAKNLLLKIRKFSIEHIPREKNKDADRMVNAALDAIQR